MTTRPPDSTELVIIGAGIAGVTTAWYLQVLGPVPGSDGLLVDTGFSGHGFGIGPGAGRVTAELAAGRTPAVDIEAFRTSRFAPAGAV